jgi:hypothetical protein
VAALSGHIDDWVGGDAGLHCCFDFEILPVCYRDDLLENGLFLLAGAESVSSASAVGLLP